MPNKYGIEPLIPAYGRDYKNKKALEEDWFGGKDFKTAFGQYCSVRDFGPEYYPLNFRYGKLRKTMVIKKKREAEK